MKQRHRPDEVDFLQRLTSKLDPLVRRVQLDLPFGTRLLVMAGVYALYAFLMIFSAGRMGLSSNYFVLLPLFSAALLFGIRGGLVFGLLALPSNVLIYALLGLSEFAPTSKPVAWMWGLITGAVVGYFSDLFHRLHSENRTARKAEADLRKDVTAKSFLLEEVHHRVKNNLGIISGLLELKAQDDSAVDDRARHGNVADGGKVDQKCQLEDIKRRLLAMAMVHDMLYQKERYAEERNGGLNIAGYLSQLAETILESVSGDARRIRLQVQAEEKLRLDMDTTVCIGLVLNEFIVNSVKHAFAEHGDPAISLCLHADETGAVVLNLADNGPGFAQCVDLSRRGTVGMRLVNAMVDRMNARWEIDGSNGTRLRIVIPRRG